MNECCSQVIRVIQQTVYFFVKMKSSNIVVVKENSYNLQHEYCIIIKTLFLYKLYCIVFCIVFIYFPVLKPLRAYNRSIINQFTEFFCNPVE